MFKKKKKRGHFMSLKKDTCVCYIWDLLKLSLAKKKKKKHWFCLMQIQITYVLLVVRGGARNFDLGESSCDANILVKTNFYTHMYIN